MPPYVVAPRHGQPWAWLHGRRGGPSLDAAALRAVAERGAGRSDWDPAVLEPQALLAEDLAEHPPSWLGRIAIAESLTRAGATHLRARDLPVPPVTGAIFIVGLHRTGTTLLQHLLSALPGRSGVPFYRLIEPFRPSLLEARTALWLTSFLDPEMELLHPIRAGEPEECWPLLMPSWCCFDWGYHWRLPRYDAWLAAQDLRPAYLRYRALLAHLAIPRPVLKSPTHLYALPALREAFPDATIVWIHRDPAASVASFAALSAVHRRGTYGSYEPVETGRTVLSRMATTVARAVRADVGVHHVAYEALVRDPEGVVAGIAAAAGDPWSTEVAARVRAAAPRRPRPGDHALETWGLTREDVAEAFGDYRASWGRWLGR